MPSSLVAEYKEILDVSQIYEEIREDVTEVFSNRGKQVISRSPDFYSMIYNSYDAAFYHVLRQDKSVFDDVRGKSEKERIKSWNRWKPVFSSIAKKLYIHRESIVNCIKTFKEYRVRESKTSNIMGSEDALGYWIPRLLSKIVSDVMSLEAPESQILTLLQQDFEKGDGHTLLEKLLTLLPQPLFSEEVAHLLFFEENGLKGQLYHKGNPFKWRLPGDIKNIPAGLLRASVERTIFLAHVYAKNPHTLATYISEDAIQLKEDALSAMAVPISNAGLPEGLLFAIGYARSLFRENVMEDIEGLVKRAARRIFDAKLRVLLDGFQDTYRVVLNAPKAFFAHIHKAIPYTLAWRIDPNGQVLERKALLFDHESRFSRWYRLQDYISPQQEEEKIIRILREKMCEPVDIAELNLPSPPGFPVCRPRSGITIPLNNLTGNDDRIMLALPFVIPPEERTNARRMIMDILRSFIGLSHILSKDRESILRRLVGFIHHEVRNQIQNVKCANSIDEAKAFADILQALCETLSKLGSPAPSGRVECSWKDIREIIGHYDFILKPWNCPRCGAKFEFSVELPQIDDRALMDKRIGLLINIMLSNAIKHHAEIEGSHFKKAGARIVVKQENDLIKIACTSWYSKLSADQIRLSIPARTFDYIYGNLACMADNVKGFAIFRALAQDLNPENVYDPIEVTHEDVGGGLFRVTLCYSGHFQMR